jgi:biotin/methionine sulfoxide reductase
LSATRGSSTSGWPPRAKQFAALVANNPATRLHGQPDLGAFSQASACAPRAGAHPPTDAAKRGSDGDVVRLWNDRGAVSRARSRRTTCGRAWCSSTGAWFDPYDAQAGSQCGTKPER